MFKDLWQLHFVRMLSLCSIAIIGITSSTIYIPSFPSIQQEFHTIPALMQLSLSVFLVTSGLGQLVIGPISDVKGRVNILRYSLLLYTIAAIFLYFSTSIEMLIFLRAFQGLFASVGLVLMRSISRDLFKGDELTQAFAIIVAIISMMPAVGPGLGGLLDSLWGWRSVFLFLVIFGAYLTCLSFFVMKETNPRKKGQSLNIKAIIRDYKFLLSDASFMAYAFVLVGFFGGVLAFGTISGYVFMGYFGWPSYLYVIVGVVMASGSVVGSMITHRFARRLSRPSAILIGGLFSVVSLMVMAVWNYHTPTPVGLLVPVFFFLAGGGVASSNATSAALDLHPTLAGTASALLGCLQMLSGAIVTIVGAVAIHNPFYVVVIMMVSAIFMVVSYSFVIHRHHV